MHGSTYFKKMRIISGAGARNIKELRENPEERRKEEEVSYCRPKLVHSSYCEFRKNTEKYFFCSKAHVLAVSRRSNNK